ncbi:unnamed protein product [Paramecium sonneborni]|uniref:Uncharacterized protein n=1 Tax=Paramecium sonneborni TaxID=65129 RepID=A0A8S1RM44_9CILI|nr:unnamed protein product [Paramecium sonneborni]
MIVILYYNQQDFHCICNLFDISNIILKNKYRDNQSKITQICTRKPFTKKIKILILNFTSHNIIYIQLNHQYFLQGFKVDIPIKNYKFKGGLTSYPIKLFYTSNIPIILQTALVSNLYFLSQFLYRNFRGNFLIRLLGHWQELDGVQTVPIGGLVYYVSPPKSISEAIFDPIHISIVHCLHSWNKCSITKDLSIAKLLNELDMQIVRHRDSSVKEELKRYIPIPASFGGKCIRALTILADFLGAIGPGTVILLSVTIIYGYLETLKKEKEQGTLELF